MAMSDETAVRLISEWYEHEPDRYRSRIGIPNAALHVLEKFRLYFPLRDSHFLTRGGGQVAGMSGASGDIIVARFAPKCPSLGTEAGRTSRATPAAARRLAKLLNGLPAETIASHEVRDLLANTMQRWIVEHALVPALEGSIPTVRINSMPSLRNSIENAVQVLAREKEWESAVRSVLSAVLREVFDIDVAPQHTEELRVGDATFIVAENVTRRTTERCKETIVGGSVCILIVPDDKVEAAIHILDYEGISGVDVNPVGSLAAHIVHNTTKYENARSETLVSRISQRIQDAERTSLFDR